MSADETEALVVKEDEGDEEGAGPEAPPKKGFFAEWWDTIDADEIFSYDTPKTLRMLDRRLGLINLAGRTVIWLYVIVYVLLIESRMFRTAPGSGPAMVKVVNDTYVYSRTSDPGSTLPFTAFDSVDVVTPFLESGALFVMTQLEKQQAQQQVGAGVSAGRRLQSSGGDESQGAQGVNWEPKFGTGSQKYVLEGVEDLKIRYYSTVSFPAIDPDGSDTHESEGGFVGKDSVQLGKNAITVADVLESAGLSMAAVQSQGAVLQVNLLWNCLLLLPQVFGKCQPKVEAVQLQRETPGFHLWRTRHYVAEGNNVRDLEKCTGIRMLWRSVGSGYQFDIFAIIFHIAAGVSLLPLAAVVTELVMWNLLPERKHYERSLYSETPDFYELDDIRADREERERRKKEEDSAVDVEALFSAEMEDEHDDMN